MYVCDSCVCVFCLPVSQAEPETFQETNVDRLMCSLGYGGSHQVKGLSDSSTLSSQPSIGEVRQQMQLLLGNAFGLAPDEAPPSNHHHPHIHPHLHSSYNPSHTSPYSEGVTSAPGTMNHPCGGGHQHGSAYGPEIHQCSLPKPVSALIRSCNKEPQKMSVCLRWCFKQKS